MDGEAEPWKNTLVGNFLGRHPGFTYVKEVVQKIWNLKGIVDVSLLENGVFVFCFSCEEDKQRVLETGPWTIARRPLILRAWSKDLALERVDLQKIPI